MLFSHSRIMSTTSPKHATFTYEVCVTSATLYLVTLIVYLWSICQFQKSPSMATSGGDPGKKCYKLSACWTYGTSLNLEDLNTHKMPPKLKQTADLEVSDAGLSRSDIDDIISKAVSAAVVAVKKELSDLLNIKLDSILKHLKANDEIIVELQQQNAKLWRHINHLIKKQDAVDTYSRVDNLIIQGLPSSYCEMTKVGIDSEPGNVTLANQASHFEISADSEALFIGFCIVFQSTDISVCHHLPRSEKSKHAPLVRFANRCIHAKVLRARKLLHDSKRSIYINKHLTKNASDIYVETRRLQKEKKIQQRWTNGGPIIVKLLSKKVRTVTCKKELKSLI